MKKQILLVIMALMLVSAVTALTIETNSSTVTGTETVTLTATYNETANATVYIGNSDLSTITQTRTFNDATSLSWDVSGLTGGTTYYWQVNISTTEATGTMAIENFTTNEYAISGNARVINLLFPLILLALVAFTIVVSKKMNADTMTIIKNVAFVVVGSLIIAAILTI